MHGFAVVVLGVLVVVSAALFGGALFEHLVVTPLWAHAPPASVTAWTHGTIQRPFFLVVTPTWAVLSLATLALSRSMPGPVRRWARASAIVGIGVVIWTAAFFLPIVHETEANRGAGLSNEEITGLVHAFVAWNQLRLVAVLASCLSALRGLMLAAKPTEGRDRTASLPASRSPAQRPRPADVEAP